MGLGLKCLTLRAQNSPNRAGPFAQTARLVRSEAYHGAALRGPQTRQKSAATAPPNSTPTDSAPRRRSACRGSPASCLPALNVVQPRIRRPPLDRSGPFFQCLCYTVAGLSQWAYRKNDHNRGPFLGHIRLVLPTLQTRQTPTRRPRPPSARSHVWARVRPIRCGPWVIGNSSRPP